MKNEDIEKVSALEAKLFELIKQESPDDYSADLVVKALQLVHLRLRGFRQMTTDYWVRS